MTTLPPIVALCIIETCRELGHDQESLMGRRRTESLAWARQVAMALAYQLSPLSSQEIGALFDRDHGTVLHAVKRLRDRARIYPQTDGALIARLHHEILSRHTTMNDSGRTTTINAAQTLLPR